MAWLLDSFSEISTFTCKAISSLHRMAREVENSQAGLCFTAKLQ